MRPATGDRFARVLPVVSTEAMSLFLDPFSRTLKADEHAVMVLDQAGWHGANTLRVPDNVTLVPLPAYSPELNPVERLWLYLRQRHLSHRLLDNYDAIVEACCQAWNQLTHERVQSLCNYPLHPTGQPIGSVVSERGNRSQHRERCGADQQLVRLANGRDRHRPRL